MSLEFIYGERGNRLLKHENYKYSFGTHLKNGNMRWRCTAKTCKAKLLTDINCEKLLETNGEHNHLTDVAKLNRQIIINAAKRKAMDRSIEYVEENANLFEKDWLLVKKKVKRTKRNTNQPSPTSGLLQLVIEIREDVCDSEDKIESKECVSKMIACDVEPDVDVTGDATEDSSDRQTEVCEPQRRRFDTSEVMEVSIEEIEAFQKKYMNNTVCID